MIFDNIFNNNYPIEKYILSVLNKNKCNVELAYNEIYNKYPMLKKKTLKDMISAVLDNEIKNNKITGIWKQIDKKWKLYNESHIVSEDNKSSKKNETELNNKKGEVKGEALPWSGPELPASSDPSSIGPNLHTYSKPQGQPRNQEQPEQVMKHDDVYENDYERMQIEYEELFNAVVSSVSNSVDIKKLNEMLLEELFKTYGSMIVKLKLKNEI